MKLISWNVNGINSVYTKGALDEIFERKPDILCIQELKKQKDHHKYIKEDYNAYFYPSLTRGAGSAIYTKEKPLKVTYGLDIEEFDREGRFIHAEFEKFILINNYFPSGSNKERLFHKHTYRKSFTEYVKNIKTDKPILICGDLNIMRSEMDAKRPELMKNKSGFLPEEQQWFKDFLKLGFVDSYREINPDKKQYSWWAYSRNARELNNGIRLDYFFVKGIEVKDAKILTEQMGSDHAPISLEIDIDINKNKKTENMVKNEILKNSS